jgi:2-polyprenyl-3-methyl-5-hydroxy-6-metoxy-1,4-benzoquinol methylase
MTKSIELKYYDQKEVWKRCDNSITEIKRAKEVINLIPDEVNSVLDIGCGNGIVTNMIKKPFIVGLDFAKIPLTQVKTNAIQASIDRLPIKSKEFDLIILTEVLEHLDDETYIKAIEEIKRLKANHLLITVPYNENVELGLCKCSVCGNLFNASHHYRKFADSWFNKEFSEYDLEKIE